MLSRVAMATVLLAATVTAPAAAQDSSMPPCADRTRSAPVLERYDQLVPGARFRVALRQEETRPVWVPVTQLGMPLHHASAIEYVGGLPPVPPTARTIEVEIEAIERVTHGPRDGTFFFTYRVRVLSACVIDRER